MKLVVGTKNPAKVHAVQEALIRENFFIVSVTSPSQVSKQPFSDDETRQGAINRARGSLEIVSDATIGLGLEGGVVETTNGMMLCNWGALAHRAGQISVASGAKIPLPKRVSEQLYEGKELGEIISQMTLDSTKKAGAIGLLTAGWINRKELFYHIVQLLIGQYYYEKHSYKH